MEEAAQLVNHSVSWMEKRGRGLPGFRQPCGKGTRAEWNRRELLKWRNTPVA